LTNQESTHRNSKKHKAQKYDKGGSKTYVLMCKCEVVPDMFVESNKKTAKLLVKRSVFLLEKGGKPKTKGWNNALNTKDVGKTRAMGGVQGECLVGDGGGNKGKVN